jgi:hypothetical protein
MIKFQRSSVFVGLIMLLVIVSANLSFVKVIEKQEENLQLKAFNDGCIFGVMTVTEDEKQGRVDPNYDAEEDMSRIDFSTWKDVPEKDIPVFKERFQLAMVACYRRYV